MIPENVQKRSDHLERFGAWLFAIGVAYGFCVAIILDGLGAW